MRLKIHAYGIILQMAKQGEEISADIQHVDEPTLLTEIILDWILYMYMYMTRASSYVTSVGHPMILLSF